MRRNRARSLRSERRRNESRPNHRFGTVLRCSRLDVVRNPRRRTTSSTTTIGRSQRPTTKVNSSGDDMRSLPGGRWRHVDGVEIGLLLHGSLQSSRWRARNEAKSVQIFGSVASSRSRLHVAMRNPRHARCSAAIAPAAVHRSDWPRTGIRFQRLVNNGQCSGCTPLSAGHQLEQGLPVA